MHSSLFSAISAATLDQLEPPAGFDAIVVGAGAAGGLASEILTKAGLKVLVLDAGYVPSFLAAPFRRSTSALISRLANPDFLPFMPPSLLYKGRKGMRLLGKIRQPVQTECYAWERRPDAFVDDLDCPYTTEPHRPFTWIRARGLQGRVGIPGHGRQYLRFGADDFMPADGESPPWPLSPYEIDPWYLQVERRLAISGAKEGLSWLPDCEITHELKPYEAEAVLIETVKARWPDAHPILGRYAAPADTLEGAARTGGLLLRQGAVVRQIEVEQGRVTGVSWVDQVEGREAKAIAPLVFLCASALETTRILMLSRDRATGRQIGAESDALGHNLMDHVMLKAEGVGGALPGDGSIRQEDGRCIYLPRFDARNSKTPQSARGFGVQVYQSSIGGGGSFFTAVAFSEMLPNRENRIVINARRVDRWGIPTLHIDCSHGAQEIKRAHDQTLALRELSELLGVTLSRLDETPPAPGTAVHECGTARMGRDPATSVLDPHNQCWDASGLYVTDSASFPSQGSQNPTLTVMALTARACAHALASPS